MEIKGQIHQILPAETLTLKNGKEFNKQIFIMTVKDGNFDKKIAFIAKGDKCIQQLKEAAIGDIATAFINIESREWNGKWFTDVAAWKLVVELQAKSDLPF